MDATNVGLDGCGRRAIRASVEFAAVDQVGGDAVGQAALTF